MRKLSDVVVAVEVVTHIEVKLEIEKLATNRWSEFKWVFLSDGTEISKVVSGKNDISGVVEAT